MSLLANPPILLAGIAACVLGAVFLALSRGLDRKLVAALSLEVFGIGLAICSLQRGIVLFVDRDYQPTYTPPTKEYLSVPIFFPSGSDRILPVEKRHLDDIAAVYMSCKPSGVTIFGFASSAPFRGEKPKGCDSNCQNAALARRRATSVSDYLTLAGIETTPYVWGSYEEMRGKSRLRDVDDTKNLRLREERLNRRVELAWTEADCLGVELNRK
jgi:outer membrane protein OmpA-like peptidoglycan-associated protein